MISLEVVVELVHNLNTAPPRNKKKNRTCTVTYQGCNSHPSTRKDNIELWDNSNQTKDVVFSFRWGGGQHVKSCHWDAGLSKVTMT